jgi:hypothetical protein
MGNETMTTFPRSPKLLKGAVVGIDIMNPLASVVVFQYNPSQLSRSLDPQYSEAGTAKSEALRLGGAPVETISATVELDATDELERGEGGEVGLHPQIAALEMLVYPKSTLVGINTALLATGTLEVVPPVAPLTLFIYGWKRIVPVKITSLSVTESAHDPTLNPIRAEVALGMRVLTYDDLSILHPGYWTFLAHQVVKEAMATVSSASDLAAVLGDEVDVFSL